MLFFDDNTILCGFGFDSFALVVQHNWQLGFIITKASFKMEKEKQPKSLTTVQKQLLQVFPYWSPEKYESIRKEKIGPGNNSFCGSLFRFVREPKKRRKESPFGGLVVIGEWDIWDFSKEQVEEPDEILEQLESSPSFERLVGLHTASETKDKVIGNVNAPERENRESVDSDSFQQENTEDTELLDSIQKFVKTCEGFESLVSPVIWFTPKEKVKGTSIVFCCY